LENREDTSAVGQRSSKVRLDFFAAAPYSKNFLGTILPIKSKTAAAPKASRRREEGRTHLLIHVPIEEENEDRWCLWRPDHAGFDSTSIFEGALVEE
jgi:hypothetical protein